MELRNQKGLSVIEVIIAMTVTAIAFIAVLEFLRMGFNRQKSDEQAVAFQQTLLAFDAYLTDQNSCTQSLLGNPALNGYNGGNISLNFLKRKNTGNLFQNGVVTSGVKVNSINISPTPGIAPFTWNGLNYFLVDMVIDGKTSSGNNVSNAKFPFRFVISTTTAKVFVGCSRTIVSQAVYSCNVNSFPLAGYKQINGIRYGVHPMYNESAVEGIVRSFCMVSPSGIGSFFMCSVVGSCLADGPYDP